MRLMAWIKRDKQVAQAAVTHEYEVAPEAPKAKEPKPRKSRSALRGTLSMWDVRCLALGGMRLDAIRRCFGRDAAKYCARRGVAA